MKISENSWHFRLVNLCNDRPNDLCSYFWTLVRNLLVGAGIVAVIGLFVYVPCLIGYNYVAKNYIVTEEGWEHGQTTTTWHFKTKEERVLAEQKAKANVAENIITLYGSKEQFAKVQAEEKKEFLWSVVEAFAIVLGISIFLAFGWVTGDNLKDRLAQKISAFAIIPAVAVTIIVMYYSGSYSEIATVMTSDYRPRDYGLAFFFAGIHMISIAMLWAMFKSIANITAAIIANWTKKKDLSGVGVALGFIKAKKEKICPLIDYT